MADKLKKFKEERLDPISPTFCSAKWLQSYIYLHTGVTSSCNLPMAQKIDLSEISENPLYIHNTKFKIAQREEMLNGRQPELCSNCWNIENISNKVMSDRISYSKTLESHNFTNLDLSRNIVPKFVEVMFDNLCNFTCSYCDATQSSSWATDLKINGPIKTKHDPKNTYLRLGTKERLTDEQRQFLYDKTTQMIFDNLNEIEQMQFIGGEVTMIPEFQKFMDRLIQKDCSHLEIIIVSNFSDLTKIKKFIEYQKYFKKLYFLVSIDGTGKTAEFVRKGLKWDEFQHNVEYVLNNTNIELQFLGTLNVFALDGLIDFLNWFIKIRRKYNTSVKYKLHICRWPVFQVITVLPDELKMKYATDLEKWISNNSGTDSVLVETEFELVNQINQVIELLKKPSDPMQSLLQNDLILFTNEYAKRNKLDVGNTFSKDLTNWILSKEKHYGNH